MNYNEEYNDFCSVYIFDNPTVIALAQVWTQAVRAVRILHLGLLYPNGSVSNSFVYELHLF